MDNRNLYLYMYLISYLFENFNNGHNSPPWPLNPILKKQKQNKLKLQIKKFC